MILAVTYKEQFATKAPHRSRNWWPEYTQMTFVNWATVSRDGTMLTYEYKNGERGHDVMADIKAYRTYS